MAAPGQRYIPEPLNFAVMVLESVSTNSQPPLAHGCNPPFTTASDWLKLSRPKQAADPANEGSLSMSEVLAREPGNAYFGTKGFQCSAITAAVEVVGKGADLCADLEALPEILAPAQRALAHLAGLVELPQVVVIISLSSQGPHLSRVITSSRSICSGKAMMLCTWRCTEGTAVHGHVEATQLRSLPTDVIWLGDYCTHPCNAYLMPLLGSPGPPIQCLCKSLMICHVNTQLCLVPAAWAAMDSEQSKHVLPLGTLSPQLSHEPCGALPLRRSHLCVSLLAGALLKCCTVSQGRALTEPTCHAEPGGASGGGA